MNINPKLIMMIDGEPHVSGAGLLLMTAEALHGKNTSDGYRRAHSALREMLSAARAGGFTKAQLLETIVIDDTTSDRVIDLAAEAIACIGDAKAFYRVLKRAGFLLEGI